MLRHLRSALAIVLLAIVLLATAAHAQNSDEPLIRNLVLDGDEVPGAEPDEALSVYGGRDTMAAGDGGVFFFEGALSNGQTQRNGFFTTGSGGTRPVLLLADDLPEEGGLAIDGLTVSFVDDGRMVPSGDILVRSFFREGSNVLAFVTRLSGTLGTALAERRAVAPLGVVSALPSEYDFALNGGVLVTAPRVDNVEAVLRRVGYGAGEVLAADGQGVPGFPDSEFSTFFTAISVASDGRALFSATVSGAPDRVLVSAAAPPSKTLTILQGARDAIPGTGLRVHSFHDTTVGAGAAGTSRSAWMVGASVDPDAPFAQATHYFVIDTEHGAEPVMGSGSVAGDFSMAVVSSPDLDFTLADDGQVVAVADTAGPGINGDAPGVWRHDPRQETPLALLFYEGGPLPGAAGETRTITRLYVASVARDGRVAAEVQLSDGQQALLLEHPDRRGEMVVVAGTTSDMETENGPRDVIQLIGLIPQRPLLVGTGQDGRRTRFSADGDLVFFARTDTDEDTTDRNGLFAVRIGPPPEVCDVKVRRKGNTVDVRGGRGDCRVVIEVDADGGIEVFPGEGTTVNGERGPASFSGAAGLKVRMSDGQDRVEIREGVIGGEARLAGGVVIDLGAGGDTLLMSGGLEIGGSLTIKTGPRSGLDERITLDALGVGGNFRLVGNAARVVSSLNDVVVVGKTKIAVGGNLSRLSATVCAFFGKTVIQGGRTSEVVTVHDTEFGASTVFDSGRGVLDEVRVYRSTFDAGNVRVKAKKSANAVIRFEDSVLEDGGLRIDTGKEGSDVTLFQANVNGQIVVTTAGSLPARDHEITFHNSICEYGLRVKGKGNVRCSFGDRSVVHDGIDIRLKPAGFHSISMFAMEIEQGGIVVRAPADGSYVSLGELLVRQGSVDVATSRGADQIFLRDSTLGGALRVAAGDGNDELSVRGLGLSSGARIDGGSGEDSLAIDTATRRDADGEVVVTGIETETSNDVE